MARLRLAGAAALVTGASSGIGMELCRLLVSRGADVLGTARRRDRLEDLARQLAGSGGGFSYVAGDLTEPQDRGRLVEAARQRGRLDLLINNAGVGALGPFAQSDEACLRQLMEVNFFAPVELTRWLLPLLRRGHRPVICNIGSVLGHRGVPYKSEYCASKFALHGWSDALRAELAAEGIQVTLVSPSTTRSEFFDSLVATADGVRSTSFGSWSPQRVARATLAAVQRRRSEVILSLAGKALVYADRLAPPLVNRALAVRR